MKETTQATTQLAEQDEVKTFISEKVREESKTTFRLTGLSSLTPEGSSLQPEELETKLTEMAAQPEYRDIKRIVSPSGAVFLYSETHVSNNYAAILARVECADPCLTVAGTVRDEARIYPRPTRLEFLLAPVFAIPAEELEQRISETLERPEFKDIRMFQTSNGARYLYSDLYMNERYAFRLAEWEEVGRFENP